MTANSTRVGNEFSRLHFKCFVMKYREPKHVRASHGLQNVRQEDVHSDLIGLPHPFETAVVKTNRFVSHCRTVINAISGKGIPIDALALLPSTLRNHIYLGKRLNPRVAAWGTSGLRLLSKADVVEQVDVGHQECAPI